MEIIETNENNELEVESLKVKVKTILENDTPTDEDYEVLEATKLYLKEKIGNYSPIFEQLENSEKVKMGYYMLLLKKVIKYLKLKQETNKKQSSRYESNDYIDSIVYRILYDDYRDEEGCYWLVMSNADYSKEEARAFTEPALGVNIDEKISALKKIQKTNSDIISEKIEKHLVWKEVIDILFDCYFDSATLVFREMEKFANKEFNSQLVEISDFVENICNSKFYYESTKTDTVIAALEKAVKVLSDEPYFIFGEGSGKTKATNCIERIMEYLDKIKENYEMLKAAEGFRKNSLIKTGFDSLNYEFAVEAYLKSLEFNLDEKSEFDCVNILKEYIKDQVTIFESDISEGLLVNMNACEVVVPKTYFKNS